MVKKLSKIAVALLEKKPHLGPGQRPPLLIGVIFANSIVMPEFSDAIWRDAAWFGGLPCWASANEEAASAIPMAPAKVFMLVISESPFPPTTH
jgi:hypothetical protein